MEEKSVLDILREKNEKAELPQKFTQEELLEIYKKILCTCSQKCFKLYI